MAQSSRADKAIHSARPFGGGGTTKTNNFPKNRLLDEVSAVMMCASPRTRTTSNVNHPFAQWHPARVVDVFVEFLCSTFWGGRAPDVRLKIQKRVRSVCWGAGERRDGQTAQRSRSLRLVLSWQVTGMSTDMLAGERGGDEGYLEK
jgi:hypothetical protein